MADNAILAPVEGADPCGEDLRWDAEFMAVMQLFDNLVLGGNAGVVEGESVESSIGAFADVIDRIDQLCERTKDLRLLALRAEAAWRSTGLSAFALALEELVAAAELWPDPATGAHPRADEMDGDLGERVAPLGKLLNVAPSLAATIGWGESPAIEARQHTTSTLQGVFTAWTARLEAAFADDLPSHGDAWNAIRALLPTAGPALEDEEGAADGGGEATAPPTVDAWDLIERAAELLSTQDRHSPALPVLHLLLIWRSRGILEIAEGMRKSGLTMEQLLDSVSKQITIQ